MPIGYQPVRKGTPLTAKYLDQNLARGPMRGSQLSGNLDKRQFPQGTAIDAPSGGSVSGWSDYMRWAEVQAVYADYLDVKSYVPATGGVSGQTFAVAKPYLLQQTPFDGVTVAYIDGTSITYTADATDPEYKRNHDDGAEDADFVITPNYFIGEQIVILRMPTYIDGTLYQWVEHCPGRYWARVDE